MNASKKQIGYILYLSKSHEHLHYEWADFTDEKGDISISTTEANKLIRELRTEPDQCDIMRKKIISMAKTIGWVTYPHGPTKPVADMDRIEKWCVKFGKFHKKLNQHTYKELTELVSQFQYGVMKTELEKKGK